MGSVLESCKRTIKCYDCEDEKGYIRTRIKNIASNSGRNGDINDESETEEKEVKKRSSERLNDVKISFNTVFMQHYNSPLKYYEELEELGVGKYGVVKKVKLIKIPEVICSMKIISEENIIQGEGASLIYENEILNNLEHPNIIKEYESYVFEKQLLYCLRIM